MEGLRDRYGEVVLRDDPVHGGPTSGHRTEQDKDDEADADRSPGAASDVAGQHQREGSGRGRVRQRQHLLERGSDRIP